MNDSSPWLIPAPRRFARAEGTVRLPDELTLPGPHAPADLDLVGEGLSRIVRIERNAGMGNEAHRLTVGAELPIVIEAKTPAAVQHGLVTLVQLLRQFGRELPCCTIEDEPAFANRGVMLDV